MVDEKTLRKLQLSKFKLRALLDITLAINNNLSTDGLINIFKNILTKDLGIGKVLIFKNQEQWECVLASGYDYIKHFKAADIQEEMLKFEDITSITPSYNAFSNSHDVIIPVFHKERPLAYVLIGDVDEKGRGTSPTIKHMNFVQTLTNIIIVAVENKRLYKENLQQEVLHKELEVARNIQNMLVPDMDKLKQYDGVSFKAYYNPHYEIGGDYYDIVDLGPAHVGFCIADVSGKGISAALLMSNFQANLRAQFNETVPLRTLVKQLNDKVFTTTKGDSFITLFLAKYNVEDGRLAYINAGHNPPLLFSKEENRLSFLEKGCVPLGMFDRIPKMQAGLEYIKSKARLVCYTDGLVEVGKGDDVEYGTQLLEEHVQKDIALEQMMDEITQLLQTDMGEESPEYFDDITILAAEFSKEGS